MPDCRDRWRVYIHLCIFSDYVMMFRLGTSLSCSLDFTSSKFGNILQSTLSTICVYPNGLGFITFDMITWYFISFVSFSFFKSIYVIPSQSFYNSPSWRHIHTLLAYSPHFALREESLYDSGIFFFFFLSFPSDCCNKLSVLLKGNEYE